MSILTREAAQNWITRWDRQQEGYLPDREERFTALIDAVEAGAGRSDPLVLDLGCGPGSLSSRLLDRLPGATVVAIDADPLLLALGDAVNAGRPGLRFADHDLREPGWAAALGLPRPADVAVSTTALHWLSPGDLRTMLAELTSVLRPGGLFLNGDHMEAGDVAPRLGELERAVHDRATARRFGAGMPEDWRQWWDAAGADPELAELCHARERRVAGADHHGSESLFLSTHVAALREAGFGEIGTLWQNGHNRLLGAIYG
ncbi:methyltransferase [Sphaerisporangium krabiense]|uniref:SAM-dependent methyltransferase n=1 Tax=Sphaerisporangium krabiense TaxID=763782 RepID=A0A7W9DV25_9ACTN|nr:class I SAM-dependent methyltransferase [Sphaerisporangium krabiense]MBB5630985.1 SAM-dependent methyltransferase [Sphaerisporangium krabiense]GII65867.1 methyltransferase [Sphaerisporangium krabiense]